MARYYVFFISVCCFLGLLRLSLQTFRHYGIYTLYGTGDTILTSWDAHGGSQEPHKKWVLECMDGEAVIGTTEMTSRIWYVWCKFMFPYKPPSQGLYPYYPSCHVRNFTINAFCYAVLAHEKTVNTFITGFYGKQWNFIISRAGLDNLQPYKCCKTPAGYYIDYTHCYYQPTHDPYWEYYDSPNYFLVFCATGFVMTGLKKQTNPYTKPDSHIDWIQCCRVGFGVKPIQPPASNQQTTTNTTSAAMGRIYYNQMPTAYEYPRQQRGGAVAHSRFAVEPARSLDEEHHQSYDMYPWPASGERDSVVPQNYSAKSRVVDQHFVDQLKAFFGGQDDSGGSADARTQLDGKTLES